MYAQARVSVSSCQEARNLAGPTPRKTAQVRKTGDTTFAIDRSTMNTLDVSADIGAGVSFKMPSGVMLFLEATDAIGLVNIANSYGESVVKSQDIRLAAGILFPLN